jgi:hypothetical protein
MKKQMTPNTTGKLQRTFAKFDDGPWYAILPGMEEPLRNAGAEISHTPGQSVDSIAVDSDRVEAAALAKFINIESVFI